MLGQLSAGVPAKVTGSPLPSSLAVCHSGVYRAQKGGSSRTRGVLGEDDLRKHSVFRFAELTENWEWARALPSQAGVVFKNC